MQSNEACINYCRPALLPRRSERHGRVKPDVVLVNGKDERHAEGAYYLDWREGSKRVRLSVALTPSLGGVLII